MQKPLITTNVASLPEVVWWKVIFVQAGSSQKLLDAILKLKENQQDVETLPTKRFDRDVTIEMIEEIYQNL
jgi:hypothetical protein